MWDLIFQLVGELKIQVFGTTHSNDCVVAFQEISQRRSAESMLINLGRSVIKRDQGKIIPTPYDNDGLQLAADADLEVR